MEKLINLILLFFIYSFLGWCIEVTLKYIQFHRFINRGFLTGPVCPIYGCGAALITLIVGSFAKIESSVGTTFVLSFIICGTLEYMTSLVMEKHFHARWWDYSQKPMNLHGRVWIGNLVLFGLGGVAIIHIINPVIYDVLGDISVEAKSVLTGLLSAVFAVDYLITHFVLKLVKTGVESSKADNTEDIRKEISMLLSDKSFFHKRFADAYPEVIYRTERINARIAAVKAETERLRKEAEQLMMKPREYVADFLEPSILIKNSVINKQDQLIRLLYDNESASNEMRELMQEIERDMKRLEGRPVGGITVTRKESV